MEPYTTKVYILKQDLPGGIAGTEWIKTTSIFPQQYIEMMRIEYAKDSPAVFVVGKPEYLVPGIFDQWFEEKNNKGYELNSHWKTKLEGYAMGLEQAKSKFVHFFGVATFNAECECCRIHSRAVAEFSRWIHGKLFDAEKSVGIKDTKQGVAGGPGGASSAAGTGGGCTGGPGRAGGQHV